jgi:uncharacterized protein YjbJ (UPF0337 family)
MLNPFEIRTFSSIRALSSSKKVNYSFIPLGDYNRRQRWVYYFTVYIVSGLNILDGRSCTMNWDRIEGQWKQGRGRATHHWGKVMNDELAAIAGKYEDLVGRLQENYGIAKEDAKVQVDKYKKTVEQLKKSNSKLIQLQKSLDKKEKSGARPVITRTTSRKSTRSKSKVVY